MEDNKLKHLEFIQQTVNRMNQNSFAIKGWMITLVSAFLALYVSSSNKLYIAIAIVPTAIFWFLDAYYLQEERKYRRLYNDVAGVSGKETSKKLPEFAMSIDRYKGSEYAYTKSLFSLTIFPVYALILIGLSIASIVL